MAESLFCVHASSWSNYPAWLFETHTAEQTVDTRCLQMLICSAAGAFNPFKVCEDHMIKMSGGRKSQTSE